MRGCVRGLWVTCVAMVIVMGVGERGDLRAEEIDYKRLKPLTPKSEKVGIQKSMIWGALEGQRSPFRPEWGVFRGPPGGTPDTQTYNFNRF